jgi:hypothetical protein
MLQLVDLNNINGCRLWRSMPPILMPCFLRKQQYANNAKGQRDLRGKFYFITHSIEHQRWYMKNESMTKKNKKGRREVCQNA